VSLFLIFPFVSQSLRECSLKSHKANRLFALMSVLAKSLLALVGRHLVSLVLLSVRHNLMNFMVNNHFKSVWCAHIVHTFGLQKYNYLFTHTKICHLFYPFSLLLLFFLTISS